MGHNKFVGWEAFLGFVERAEKASPWLSRQIVKHAAEWPFWFSGLKVVAWDDELVRVRLPLTAQTRVNGEFSSGHLGLGAELALRLYFVRFAQEFPFRYRIVGFQMDCPRELLSDVEFKFSLALPARETLRMELSKAGRAREDFIVQGFLPDGRLAMTSTFTTAFQLEKFLPLTKGVSSF